MAFFNGKNGSLTIGGVVYPMEEWSLDIEIEEVEVTNFMSGGFKQVMGGIAGGSVSASGPYNGTSPITTTPNGVTVGNIGYGAIGQFDFGLAAGVGFSWPVLVTGVSIGQNVKEKATIEISGSLTNTNNY